MTSKLLIYLITIAVSLGGGLYLGNKGNVYIPTGDTLKVGATTFELDSITQRVIAQLDTFTKPKPIIKWKTKWDTIKGDTVLIFPNDTVYPARFYKDDLHIRIIGTTYYSLHNQNTFDLEYTIKPRNLLLETFWVNNQIENRLSENGTSIPFKSKIEYKEFNQYINSLKPKWYEKPYFTIPATILGIGGLIYLVK